MVQNKLHIQGEQYLRDMQTTTQQIQQATGVPHIQQMQPCRPSPIPSSHENFWGPICEQWTIINEIGYVGSRADFLRRYFEQIKEKCSSARQQTFGKMLKIYETEGKAGLAGRSLTGWKPKNPRLLHLLKLVPVAGSTTGPLDEEDGLKAAKPTEVPTVSTDDPQELEAGMGDPVDMILEEELEMLEGKDTKLPATEATATDAPPQVQDQQEENPPAIAIQEENMEIMEDRDAELPAAEQLAPAIAIQEGNMEMLEDRDVELPVPRAERPAPSAEQLAEFQEELTEKRSLVRDQNEKELLKKEMEQEMEDLAQELTNLLLEQEQEQQEQEQQEQQQEQQHKQRKQKQKQEQNKQKPKPKPKPSGKRKRSQWERKGTREEDRKYLTKFFHTNMRASEHISVSQYWRKYCVSLGYNVPRGTNPIPVGSGERKPYSRAKFGQELALWKAAQEQSRLATGAAAGDGAGDNSTQALKRVPPKRKHSTQALRRVLPKRKKLTPKQKAAEEVNTSRQGGGTEELLKALKMKHIVQNPMELLTYPRGYLKQTQRCNLRSIYCILKEQDGKDGEKVIGMAAPKGDNRNEPKLSCNDVDAVASFLGNQVELCKGGFIVRAGDHWFAFRDKKILDDGKVYKWKSKDNPKVVIRGILEAKGFSCHILPMEGS